MPQMIAGAPMSDSAYAFFAMTPDEKREAFKRFMDERDLSAYAWSMLTKGGDGEKRAVSEGTIRAFLEGKTRSFTGDTEQRLADALGISVDKIYSSSDFGSPPKHPMVASGEGAGPANENKLRDGAMDVDKETLVRWMLRCDIDTRIDIMQEVSRRQEAMADQKGERNENP